MPEDQTQEVEIHEQTPKGKTVLSFTQPTPMWANWIFRIQFFANKAIMFYLAGTTLISPDNIKQYILILASIDLFVWGVDKSIGIKPPDDNS